MENSNSIENTNKMKSSAFPIGGVILVLLGVIFLVSEFIDLPGSIVLPVLGLIFAVSGAISKKSGLMVPAGILLGLGAGVVLTESGLTQNFAIYNDAIILGGIAFGFLLVAGLSSLFTDNSHWWSLIVASVIGLLAFVVAVIESPGDSALKTAVMGLLNWAPYIWPAVLIILGLGILLRRKS